MIRNIVLVYRHAACGRSVGYEMSERFQLREADEQSVRQVFASEPNLRDRSLLNLKRGCVGVMIMAGDRCVSRAWMSVPNGNGPHHLPRFVKSLGVYWIFYCATIPAYRGLGLYKHCLTELIRRARASEAEVMIDTTPENTISRWAIESVGFEPQGVITSFRIPKTEFVMGRWNRRTVHPRLVEATSQVAPASHIALPQHTASTSKTSLDPQT